jgi:hypothetical protein
VKPDKDHRRRKKFAGPAARQVGEMKTRGYIPSRRRPEGWARRVDVLLLPWCIASARARTGTRTVLDSGLILGLRLILGLEPGLKL